MRRTCLVGDCGWSQQEADRGSEAVSFVYLCIRTGQGRAGILSHPPTSDDCDINTSTAMSHAHVVRELGKFLDALDVAVRHGAAKETAALRGARYPATDTHIDSPHHQNFYHQTWDLLASCNASLQSITAVGGHRK